MGPPPFAIRNPQSEEGDGPMHVRNGRHFILLMAMALWAGAPAQAAVKLHGLFSEGAVLQQKMDVPVWGTAKDGENITVEIHNQKATTTARDGRWLVRLKPLPAGGPYQLIVRGENTVEVPNVLVGEVWVCSGQSNMEWPLSQTHNPEPHMASSKDPQLRLYSVPRAAADQPASEVNARWEEAGPDTVPRFSAVGYFFGRDLRQALKVPVGLIKSAVGGTPAEAWADRATLESNPEFKSILDGYAQALADYPKAMERHREALEKHKEAVAKARQEGKQPPQAPRAPYGLESLTRPSGLYNAMIRPLQPYAIKGAIWYQGESNAGRAYQYRTLFPAMIANWRKAWGQGDFPFLFVQLAPFHKIDPEPKDSQWAELREAQLLTARKVPAAGMAVITDVGEEDDIHPRKKEPVGARLALAARGIAYGERIAHSGPVYEGMTVEKDRVALRFKQAGGGLVAQGGGPLKGFAVAGEDKKFVNAQAEIKGNTVVIHSPQVARPVAVRYGWANFPVVNLANKEGLLASPFRTDDFPLTTKPK